MQTSLSLAPEATRSSGSPPSRSRMMAAPPEKEVRSDHANAANATTAPTPTSPLSTSVPRSSIPRRSEGSRAI